nr:CAP domain-containing protein [Sphingomonas sp. IC-56]
MRNLAPLLLLALVPACSGGGGSDGGGSVVTPTPTPTPGPIGGPITVPTPTPTPPPTSNEPATGSDFLTSVAQLYTVQPNIAACQPGQLKPEVGARVLATLNDIRARHGLPPVSYASAEEAAEMQSSLMMAANGQLSHTPPASWLCYTNLGATAAGNSNIYLGYGGGLRYSQDADIMIGWLTDVDNLIANNIGHRRWLLYPFLSSVAYGRVAGPYVTNARADGASIKVINSTQNTAGPLPDFVAYPYQDYPARYYANGALLSFEVIADKNRNFGSNAQVSYANATVSVQQRDGGTLAVSNIAYDNDGYGLPNNLQWNVAGLAPNVTYDVTIGNVSVAGTPRNYSYYFRLTP